MSTDVTRQRGTYLTDHQSDAIRLYPGGMRAFANKIGVSEKSVGRWTHTRKRRTVDDGKLMQVLVELERQLGRGRSQDNDGHNKAVSAGGARLIEAVVARYHRHFTPLWDLPVNLFGDRVHAARDLNTDFLAVRQHLRDPTDVDDPHRFAIARLAVSLTDLSFAAPTLEHQRADAIALGISIVAPLICSRRENLAREARLLTAQLLRAAEGELWSFVRRPNATPAETGHVLNIYDESDHHLRRAAGGHVVLGWAEDDRHRFAINEICRARTLLQQGLFKQAEAAIDSARVVSGRLNPTVSIYRSHLRTAEGKVEDAVAELEIARSGFTGLRTDLGMEGAAACDARLYEITGSDEYATGAANALNQWALRYKYADTACFDCVEGLLLKRRTKASRRQQRN